MAEHRLHIELSLTRDDAEGTTETVAAISMVITVSNEQNAKELFKFYAAKLGMEV